MPGRPKLPGVMGYLLSADAFPAKKQQKCYNPKTPQVLLLSFMIRHQKFHFGGSVLN